MEPSSPAEAKGLLLASIRDDDPVIFCESKGILNQTGEVPGSYRRYLASAFRKGLGVVGTPVLIEFRQGENPYRHKRNVLTDRQRAKRRRMIRHAKRK